MEPISYIPYNNSRLDICLRHELFEASWITLSLFISHFAHCIDKVHCTAFSAKSAAFNIVFSVMHIVLKKYCTFLQFHQVDGHYTLAPEVQCLVQIVDFEQHSGLQLLYHSRCFSDCV